MAVESVDAPYMAVIDPQTQDVLELLYGADYGLYFRDDREWLPVESNNASHNQRFIDQPVIDCTKAFIPRFDTAQKLKRTLDVADLV